MLVISELWGFKGLEEAQVHLYTVFLKWLSAVVGNGLQYEFIILFTPKAYFHVCFFFSTLDAYCLDVWQMSSFLLLVEHMFALRKIAEAV